MAPGLVLGEASQGSGLGGYDMGGNTGIRPPARLPPLSAPPVGISGADTMASNGSDAPAHTSVPVSLLSALAPPPPRNRLAPLHHDSSVSSLLAPGAIASPVRDGPLSPPADASPQDREMLATYASALPR